VCVDQQANNSNCGACGKVCDAGTACSAGQCVVTCSPPQTVCNGACVNKSFDPSNCGACGVVCGADKACVNGACQTVLLCTNIATQATPTTSGGGSEPTYGPIRLNNGVAQVCSEWSWIANSSASTGAYFQYTWSTPQTIGSFYVDGENATSPACGSSGRDIKNATVQWWNGSSWVTAGTIGSQENYMFAFSTPITTTALRLYNVVSSPGNGNSIIFEWYVYPGAGCPVP
jgi:hypothetical protein